MNEMIEIQSNESLDGGYHQLTIVNTEWTGEARESMRERGFDDMDMLRAWLS